jgi:hypothetical protein
MRNLDFLIPVPYPAGWIIPKTVVFHDDIDLATEGASYHEQRFRLPEEFRRKDLIAHYQVVIQYGIFPNEVVEVTAAQRRKKLREMPARISILTFRLATSLGALKVLNVYCE